MSKILVFNVPAHGHVNPTLPVVGELFERGERVIYYLTDAFEPQIRHTGASFHRIDGIQDRFSLPPGIALGLRSASSSMPQRVITFILRMMTDSLRLVPQLIDKVKTEEADYVIYGRMCLWGRVLAELLGLPAVAFIPTYAMNEHSPLRRLMYSRWSAILDGEVSGEVAQAMSDFKEASQELHERYGLAPLGLTDLFAHAEELNIVTLPRQFQPEAHAFDESYVFVGPCIAPRGDVSGFSLHRFTDHPILYISLGTVFNANPEFFAVCFDAFADSNWQVVLSFGAKANLSTMGKVPGNFFVSPYLPQLEILQHANAFVTHGGMNSTMEAIYYGVPMVVVPQQPEQAMTASRVAELSLGVAFEPEHVTASALRNAVTTVVSDASYRDCVTHMQEATRDAGGYLRAADVIQQFGSQLSVGKIQE
jgi:MGT family glycosyltransferase